MELTKHYTERQTRIDFIKSHIGIGNPLKTFKWNKGHPSGPELHTITDTGIIIIRNANTNKLITMLIARPGQIWRYYIANKQKPPEDLMELAALHQSQKYNYI